MHQTHPVHHHPDIRWLVAVTMIITAAIVLFVYTMWDVTRPQPVLLVQIERQNTYIAELQSNITQLNAINQSLQKEIKNKNEDISRLQAELLAAQAKNLPKN